MLKSVATPEVDVKKCCCWLDRAMEHAALTPPLAALRGENPKTAEVGPSVLKVARLVAELGYHREYI